MARLWLLSGSALGFLSVLLGAMGAHAFQARLSVGKAGEWYELGVRYAMVHALALVLLGGFFERLPARAATVSGWGFLLGTLLFSGSLIALAFTGVKKLGAITPIGGLGFLVGWLALLVAVWSWEAKP